MMPTTATATWPSGLKSPIEADGASPRRVVSLSAGSSRLLWELGLWGRVVGVSAFCTQPEGDPRPVLGGFSKVTLDKVKSVEPDLVLLYSNVQADLAAELIRAGVNVLALNPFTLRAIGESIFVLGQTMGVPERAGQLAARFGANLEALRPDQSPARDRPVYFEEWHEPLVCGVPWVGEGLELLGCRDVFAERRSIHTPQRQVSAEEVIARKPEVIFFSWCGKKVDWKQVNARPGWDTIPAVRNGHLYEIPSNEILQPGPGVVEGFHRMREFLKQT